MGKKNSLNSWPLPSSNSNYKASSGVLTLWSTKQWRQTILLEVPLNIFWATGMD
ncbi:MAG: hypothetical protein HQK50_19555 [Oligoflexia bacterium]|nr:hypothetical protein [Oligoflexia bacterium]MBF0367773.1 hypothetical protein [Oligoflexia bacterium]